MPGWSGLWDGVHGEAYDAMPKADALPPFQRGIIRSLMQGRAMHGHVTALGRNSPSSIAQVADTLNDQLFPGSYDYATRTLNIDYNQLNAGSPDQTPVPGSKARPAVATEADMAHTYDTTLRNGHPADKAANGVTSPEVTEVISDGT